MSSTKAKASSKVILAGLIVLTLAISLVGSVLVQSSLPQEVPTGKAHVTVDVAQAPSRSTGMVTLFVLPRMS